MIGFLISAVKIIFLLGFLILIHESGHFFIAKLFKVKVEEFAIGFGPKIFTKQGKETKYELRLIPLGGFVRMEGEEQRSDSERSFNNASIPKRMGIVAAGAIVNIVFGILVYFIIVAVVGNNVSNIVDTTNEGYIASEVGIISGDKIEKINNKKIRLKSDIDEILQNCNGEELTLLIERNNEEKEIKLKPTEKYTKSTGIYVSQAQTDDKATQIIQIEKGSNAEKDGLQVNDVIKTINGVDVRSYGSQGQQRTAALSLKLAELSIIEEITHTRPVLLLDDVLSELDDSRKKRLLEYCQGTQTFITCTAFNYPDIKCNKIEIKNGEWSKI